MAHRPRHLLFPDLRALPDDRCSVESPQEAVSDAATERTVSQEQCGEPVENLPAHGPLEPEEPDHYDDYTASWQDDYADAVGVSRWREL